MNPCQQRQYSVLNGFIFFGRATPFIWMIMACAKVAEDEQGPPLDTVGRTQPPGGTQQLAKLVFIRWINAFNNLL